MPERIVTRRTILGGGKDGKTRLDLMPGQKINLSDAHAQELERRGVVQKPQEFERTAREAEGSQGGGPLQERGVAQPVAASPGAAAGPGNDGSQNITREQPAGDKDDL